MTLSLIKKPALLLFAGGALLTGFSGCQTARHTAAVSSQPGVARIVATRDTHAPSAGLEAPHRRGASLPARVETGGEWSAADYRPPARGDESSGSPQPVVSQPLREGTLVPLAEPPRLFETPPDASVDSAGLSQRMRIPRIVLCREVRAYEDISEIDPRGLRHGQPLVLYAPLEGHSSLRTSRGFRTLTMSTLEVRTPQGRLIHRQPLGTASDLSNEARREFFLTHDVEIPADLPAGDYLLRLTVDDLPGRQSASAELAVRVQGGS